MGLLFWMWFDYFIIVKLGTWISKFFIFMIDMILSLNLFFFLYSFCLSWQATNLWYCESFKICPWIICWNWKYAGRMEIIFLNMPLLFPHHKKYTYYYGSDWFILSLILVVSDVKEKKNLWVWCINLKPFITFSDRKNFFK